jgi:prophage antirepressor-like protein
MSDHDSPDRANQDAPAPSGFEFENQPVGTIIRNGEVWFTAIDVCAVLEHSNPSSALLRLDQDEKDVVTIATSGGAQQINIVNESGLYHLILTSRKPQAKRFRRWVTGDVLPSIRRTGRYDGQRPNSTYAKIARSEAVTVVLPGWGRYTVLVRPDGTHRSARMEYETLLHDDNVVTLELLCHQMKPIASFWHKLITLKLVELAPDVSFASAHFSKAVGIGDEIATHVLRTYVPPRTEH